MLTHRRERPRRGGEGAMRHDWVLDVLDDLIAYAGRNDLPALASGARDLRQAVLAEIAPEGDDTATGEGGDDGTGGAEPFGGLTC